MSGHVERARELIEDAEAFLAPEPGRAWAPPTSDRDIAYGHALAALASAHLSLWAAEGDPEPLPVPVEPL
jgi:hypothetical protein